MEEKEVCHGNHMKFVNLVSKLKNNVHMSQIVDMKKSEFLILMKVESELKNSGVATVSKISTKMYLTNAAISKTIGDLEDQGYIKKITNKADKRQIHLLLTEEGKNRLSKAKKAMDDFFTSVILQLGQKNTEQLFELLKQFVDISIKESEIRTKHKR